MHAADRTCTRHLPAGCISTIVTRKPLEVCERYGVKKIEERPMDMERCSCVLAGLTRGVTVIAVLSGAVNPDEAQMLDGTIAPMQGLGNPLTRGCIQL